MHRYDSLTPEGDEHAIVSPRKTAYMVSKSPDPTVVRSIAVTTAAVVAALETNTTTSRRAVLRLTPPFSGRMRARLHVVHDGEYEGEPQPLHIDPGSLLVEDAPSYPNPDETETELRERGETYTVESHHEYHAQAVREWRLAIPDAVRDRVTLETDAGPHPVFVKVLRDDL